MNFTKEQIIEYANKLLIGLSDEEAETIVKEFSIIDENIDQINEIPNLNNIEPAFRPFNCNEIDLRDDNVESMVDISELLSNTKDIEGREIRVPKVVE